MTKLTHPVVTIFGRSVVVEVGKTYRLAHGGSLTVEEFSVLDKGPDDTRTGSLIICGPRSDGKQSYEGWAYVDEVLEVLS